MVGRAGGERAQILSSHLTPLYITEYKKHTSGTIHGTHGDQRMAIERQLSAVAMCINFDRGLYLKTVNSSIEPLHSSTLRETDALEMLRLRCVDDTSQRVKWIRPCNQSQDPKAAGIFDQANCIHVLESTQRAAVPIKPIYLGASFSGKNSLCTVVSFNNTSEFVVNVLRLDDARPMEYVANHCSLIYSSVNHSITHPSLVFFNGEPFEINVQAGSWTTTHSPIHIDTVVNHPTTDSKNQSFILLEHGEGASEAATATGTALLEHKSKANLFARAAVEMGLGPDMFIQPVAGSAVNTIVVVLGQHFMTYFGSCISVRFPAFLTSWENDVNRPFVIIWMVMDIVRKIKTIMKMVTAKLAMVRPVHTCAYNIFCHTWLLLFVSY